MVASSLPPGERPDMVPLLEATCIGLREMRGRLARVCDDLIAAREAAAIRTRRTVRR